jgi:hypothetical protein
MTDFAVRALTVSAAASLVFYWGLSASPGSNGIPAVGTQRLERLEQLLQAKPSLESTHSDYLDEIGRMADGLSSLVDGMNWSLREDGQRGCGRAYAGADADQVYLNVVFNAAIPDEQWPQAVRIVRDGAVSLSAVDYRNFVSRPGVHVVQVASADGGDIWVSTAKTARLTARSDCRLHQPVPAQ